MPDISPNQGLSLPAATDNANGPLAFDNYNDGVENRLVQRYSSTTDRTVRNGTPNTGELSYIANLDEYQRYLSSSGLWKAVRAVDKTPRAAVSRSTTQSIPNNTATAISFDTIIVNDYVLPLFSLGSPTIITLTEPGMYQITASATFDPNASGFRRVNIELAGTVVATNVADNLGASVAVGMSISALVYTATTTDQVRFIVTQNSGGALNIDLARMSAARVG